MCGSKNSFQGKYFFTHEQNTRTELSSDLDCNIDYKSSDITNFPLINLFKGRSDTITTQIRKLNTNSNSKILIYMTSHGGNNFLRIRTKTVILSDELNRTFWEMYLKNRYKEILFIVDTCEAITSFESVTAPNIFFVGSSLKDQKALSYGFDNVLMTPLSDRFTFLFSHFLDNLLVQKKYDFSLKDFFDQVSFHKEFLNSDLGIKNGIRREVINRLN